MFPPSTANIRPPESERESRGVEVSGMWKEGGGVLGQQQPLTSQTGIFVVRVVSFLCFFFFVLVFAFFMGLHDGLDSW